MKKRAWRVSQVVILCALASAGCGADGSPVGPVPSERTPFPSDGRTLGYVANQYADTVSVVDLGTLAALGEVPVGMNPVEVDGPRQIALDPARGLAYVLLTYPLTALGAHAIAHGALPPFGEVRALALLDLAPLGDEAVDRRAAALALSRDASLLAAVHDDQDLEILPTDLDSRRANVALISPAWALRTGKETDHKSAVCVAPQDVALSQDGTRAFIACTGEDSLVLVDTTSTNVVTRVPAGDGVVNKPTAIALDPAGTRVVLSNELTSKVVVFAADDSAAMMFSSDQLAGSPGPVAFLASGDWLVPLQSPDGAARLEAATGKVLAQISYGADVCESPHAATVAADGRVFLVCEGDHYSPGAVVQLDPTTLEVLGRVSVGLYPDRGGRSGRPRV